MSYPKNEITDILLTDFEIIDESTSRSMRIFMFQLMYFRRDGR